MRSNSLPDVPVFECTQNCINRSWNLTLAHKLLIEKYRKLLGSNFGRSSEKLTSQSELEALQVEMDELLGQIAAGENPDKEDEDDTIEITPHRRRRKKHGRNSIPEDMITDEIVDIPESDKVCTCCGLSMQVINTKQHLVVERIPAQYKATRYLRPVYGCSHCKETLHVAEPPVVTPIAKGLAGPQLINFVILSKYLYHLPLYRIQRQIFNESSIWFTRSTLCSWVKQICSMLERIHFGLLTMYRSSRIKHADESHLQVIIDGQPCNGWMWIGLTGDGRTAIYLYNKHRSGAAALKLLEGSKPGDYLMIDDCPSYNIPVKKLKLIGMRCLVHIRRKFIEARDSGTKKAFCKKIIIKIGQLYRIERLAAKKNMSVDQLTALRQTYSKQILDKIKVMLENPGFLCLPQSLTGNAIRHFLNNWVPATRFIESGNLPIDNSADERIVRPLAIGRNNWLHAGSEDGARWMAILYSIITTCKLNNINPEEYLKDVIMRLSIRPQNADVSDLLPVQWYKNKNAGDDPQKTPLYPSEN